MTRKRLTGSKGGAGVARRNRRPAKGVDGLPAVDV